MNNEPVTLIEYALYMNSSKERKTRKNQRIPRTFIKSHTIHKKYPTNLKIEVWAFSWSSRLDLNARIFITKQNGKKSHEFWTGMAKTEPKAPQIDYYLLFPQTLKVIRYL